MSESQKGKTRIPILVLEPVQGALIKALERLAANATYEVNRVSGFDAVIARMGEGRFRAGVLIWALQKPEEYNRSLPMLRILREGIEKGRVQIMVLLGAANAQAGERLRALGVAEIVSPATHERALSLKVERLARTVQSALTREEQEKKLAERQKERERERAAKAEQQQKLVEEREGKKEPSTILAAVDSAKKNALNAGEAANAGEKAGSAARGGRGLSGGPGGEKKPRGGVINWVAPLQHPSDCWLAQDCPTKQVGGRWVVRVRGPGPGNGKWIEIDRPEMKSGGSDSHFFQWAPYEPEKDPFVKDKGAWMFRGLRAPDFIEETWCFAGEKPWLCFVHEGKVQATRFSCSENGTLHIAKDSARVLDLLPQMFETWKKGVKIKQKKTTDEVAPEAEVAVVAKSATKKGKGESDEDPESAIFGLGGSGKKERKDSPFWGKDSEVSENRESPPSGFSDRVLRVPATKQESDFWCYPTDGGGAQRRGDQKHWAIPLVGPPEGEGNWIKEEGMIGSSHRYTWNPISEEARELIVENGAWVLEGCEPSFEGGVWWLKGPAPQLAFESRDGRVLAAKIRTRKDGALLIAHESVHAKKVGASLEKNSREMKNRIGASEEGGTEFDFRDRRSGGEGKGIRDRRTEDETLPEVEDFRYNEKIQGLDIRDKRKKADEGDERELDDSSGGLDYSRKKKKRGFGKRSDEDSQDGERGEQEYFDRAELEIGKRGGRWDFVMAGPAPEKWYVYLPVEMLMGEISDPRALACYWVYLGPERPKLVEERQLWLFRLHPVKEVKKFSELDLPVQQHLIDRCRELKGRPELTELPPQPIPFENPDEHRRKREEHEDPENELELEDQGLGEIVGVLEEQIESPEQDLLGGITEESLLGESHEREASAEGEAPVAPDVGELEDGPGVQLDVPSELAAAAVEALESKDEAALKDVLAAFEEAPEGGAQAESSDELSLDVPNEASNPDEAAADTGVDPGAAAAGPDEGADAGAAAGAEKVLADVLDALNAPQAQAEGAAEATAAGAPAADAPIVPVEFASEVAKAKAKDEEGGQWEGPSDPEVPKADAQVAEELREKLAQLGIEVPVEATPQAGAPATAAKMIEESGVLESAGKVGTCLEPSLRPLTMAFLISELLRRYDFPMREIAQRVCGYLGRSCGDIGVELWMQESVSAPWQRYSGSVQTTPERALSAVSGAESKGESWRWSRVPMPEENQGKQITLEVKLVLWGEKVAEVPDLYLDRVARLFSAIMLAKDLPGTRTEPSEEIVQAKAA